MARDSHDECTSKTTQTCRIIHKAARSISSTLTDVQQTCGRGAYKCILHTRTRDFSKTTLHDESRHTVRIEPELIGSAVLRADDRHHSLHLGVEIEHSDVGAKVNCTSCRCHVCAFLHAARLIAKIQDEAHSNERDDTSMVGS